VFLEPLALFRRQLTRAAEPLDRIKERLTGDSHNERDHVAPVATRGATPILAAFLDREPLVAFRVAFRADRARPDQLAPGLFKLDVVFRDIDDGHAPAQIVELLFREPHSLSPASPCSPARARAAALKRSNATSSPLSQSSTPTAASNASAIKYSSGFS